MKKNHISILLLVLVFFELTKAYSQAFSVNTASLLNGDDGSGGITFNISATNSVFIKDIKNAFYYTAPTTVEVWYNTTAISGPPTISAATGWISLGTVSITPANTSSSGPHILQSTIPLNLFIPGGSTYGFYISGINCAYTTYTTQPINYSDANITIQCGPNIGYGGSFPTPTFSTRLFNGEIGYDLAVFADDDAGIHEVFPTTVCAGSANIEATVKNNGTNQIDSVWLNWSINGVLQTPIHYKSLLDTLGGTGPNMDTVLLGTHTFLPNDKDTILVWSSMPNGIADTVNFNDTLKHIIKPSLNGIYTIGGVSPDYSSFGTAISDLQDLGVCGPVIFNVRGGNYYEQLNLTGIDGLSSANTILFRPDTGIIAPIQIYASGTFSDNYVVRFGNVSHITFDSIKMFNTSSSYARVVAFQGINNNITIRDCELNGVINSLASNNTTVVFDEGGTFFKNSNITLDNNLIIGGYSGIYMEGVNDSILEDHLILSNNTITNFLTCGIYLTYQNNAIINNNYIKQRDTSTTDGFGIYTNYCNTSSILANEIHLKCINTNNGIFINYCTADNSTPFTVANNMITTAYGSISDQNGINLANSSYINIYHNSINILGTSSRHAIGINIFGTTGFGNNKMINNIFSNEGGGLVAKINGDAIANNYLIKSNKNIFFSTGNNPFEVSGITLPTLKDWTTNTLLDSNSYFTYPSFFSSTNLHTNSIEANNLGDTTLGIFVDIDGDLRPHSSRKWVDIGADEFFIFIPDNDVGGANVLHSTHCLGIQNIEAVVKNYGANKIDSLIINWTINGVLQTPFYYLGILDTLNGTGQYSDTVVIGYHLFTYGIADTLTLWTSNPNGVIDTNTFNDTSLLIIKPALSGIYTIGGTTPDFPDFTSAINDLNTFGVCGAVTFHVREGNYYEQLDFGPINGVDVTKTIAFMPDPLNTLPVEISFSPFSGATNYVVQFNNTKHIRFNNILIRNTSSPSSFPINGRVLVFGSNNQYIKFKNCEIVGVPTPYTTNSIALVHNFFGRNDMTSNITFDGNTFNNGSYGLHWHGGGTIFKEDSLVLINNHFRQFSSYGVDISHQKNLIIENNFFEQKLVAATSYGLHLYDVDFYSIQRNEIQLYGTSINYGFYLRYCDGAALNPAKFINNVLVTGANNANTTVGLFSSNNTYTNFYHNSINSLGNSPTNNRVCYLFGDNISHGIKLINNIYYSKSATKFAVGGVFQNSFTDWQTNTSLDSNSLVGDPEFFGSRDLHLEGLLANDKGDSTLGVLVDFENDPRPYSSSSIVDIGADEYNPDFCTKPSSISIYDQGADSLIISWVGGLNDSVYEIEYGLSGFTLGTGILINTTSNPSVISGLTHSTLYDFYIRTRCTSNDSSIWIGPFTDSTLILCKKVLGLTLLHEDSTFINIGWNLDSIHVNYLLEYGLTGYTPGTGILITSTTNFIQVLGLSPRTQYDFYVRAICATGDTSGYFSPVTGMTGCAKVVKLPFADNFDHLDPGTGFSCLTTEYLTGCIKNAIGNQAFWQPRSLPTQTTGTGPSSDRTSGTGMYVYLESSSCWGSFDTIITPYFDLNVPIPTLDFSYHMYGSTMGNLRVIAQTMSGNTFTQFIRVNNQGNTWHDTTLVLNNVKDSVARFLIIGQIGAGSSSDMAIDDWRIYDSSPASINDIDLAKRFIVYPNPNDGIFYIKNNGNNNINSSIKVLDLQGRIVFDKSNFFSAGGIKKVDLSHVQSGVYTIFMDTGNASLQKRIIIH